MFVEAWAGGGAYGDVYAISPVVGLGQVVVVGLGYAELKALEISFGP